MIPSHIAQERKYTLASCTTRREPCACGTGHKGASYEFIMLGQRSCTLNFSYESSKAHGFLHHNNQMCGVRCPGHWPADGAARSTGRGCTFKLFCGSIGDMYSPTLAHLGTWRYPILIHRAQCQAQFAPCPLERPVRQPSLQRNTKITQTSNR